MSDTSQKTDEGNSEVPEHKLLVAEKFAEKIGGIDKAKEAVEALQQLRKSA